MAITRTQIARQLYKDGKRVGLKGGKDAARSDFGQAKGGDRGDKREQRAVATTLGISPTTQSALGIERPDRNLGQREFDRRQRVRAIERFIDRPTFGFTDAAKVNLLSPSSLAKSAFGALIGVPGLGFLSNINVNPTPTDDDDDDNRGNGDGDGNQKILPPVLAQAPRNTEQEKELSELGQLLADMSGQRYAFMADGGRIGLKGGGADFMKSDADKEFEAFKKMYMQDSMKRGEKEIKDIYEREKKKLLEKRYGVAVANGGIMSPNLVGGMMDGNIDEMGRQMYGLGKLVKKATRAVKKIAKSPIGKAALAYTLTGGIGNLAQGSRFFSGFTSPSTFLSPTKFFGSGKFLKSAPYTETMSGLFDKIGPLGLIAGTSALAGLMTKKDEEDDEINLEEARGPRLDIAKIRARPYEAMGQAYGLYAEGGDVKEPVAKKTLPLLDMDGKEKDYRETGGFVDIGRMEKADDVPARLSKNEFVFTADAVRNAGDGDIDKGAEVMYNMMKNLESGGDVSEESQGLEGARNMFQTSQRLEEVL